MLRTDLKILIDCFSVLVYIRVCPLHSIRFRTVMGPDIDLLLVSTLWVDVGFHVMVQVVEALFHFYGLSSYPSLPKFDVSYDFETTEIDGVRCCFHMVVLLFILLFYIDPSVGL